jgi:uncharacterized protein (UPF0297 family)
MALSDDEIDHIAERAADKAVSKIMDQVYREVGKSFVSKVLWVIGIVLVGAWAWMNQHGFLK